MVGAIRPPTGPPTRRIQSVDQHTKRSQAVSRVVCRSRPPCGVVIGTDRRVDVRNRTRLCAIVYTRHLPNLQDTA